MSTATLTPEQRSAVEATGPIQVISAGPGTGKTHTMVEKIAHLLEVRRREPECITAVSFTRNAAGELRKRAIERVGKRANGITFGTSTSLALRVLREGAKFIGLPSGITVYDDQDRKDILDELRTSLRCREPQRDVLAAVRSVIENPGMSIDEAFALAEIEDPHKVRGVVEAYVDRLRSSAAVDLEGIIPRAIGLLESCADRDFVDTWRRRARSLIVDEYHDTSETESRFYEILAPQEFIVVGDPRQEIYSFRGTSKRFLEDLAARDGAVRTSLTQSFRSGRAVVEAANNLIAKNLDAPPEQLVPANEDGRVAIFKVEDYSTLTGIRWNLEGNATVAILARTNMELEDVVKLLRLTGVPTESLSTPRAFYRLAEVRAFHAALRCAYNPRDAIATRTVCAEFPGMPRPDSEAWFAAVLTATETERPLLEVIGWRFGKANLMQVARTAADVLTKAYETEGRTSRADNVREAFRQVEQFAEISGDDLEAFVDWLQHKEIADRIRPERTTPAIDVGTIHAAKGLEWDVVYLVGAYEGCLPHERAIAENRIDEERRLAYVAVTRARRDLFVIYPIISNAPPSRFCAEMREAPSHV